MSGKRESVSLESLVYEALARMKEITAGASHYEVDRSSAHWTVRRSSTTLERDFPARVVAELPAGRRN